MKYLHAFAAAVGLAACTNPTSVNESPTIPSSGPTVDASASATATASASATATATASASASASATASASAPASACPAGMLLVDGELCSEVIQNCLEYMDPPEAGTARRCARFARTVCTGEKVAHRFCIDRDEYVEAGETLPAVRTSFAQAEAKCSGQGKRLCLESEWTLACEGPKALPYPTGVTRPTTCNHDQTKLTDANGKLLDLRRAPSDLAKCTSPYGVRSLTGNVDEWTVRDLSAGPYRSALKGGWWMPARNRCRPATVAHDEQYADFQTGFRCCADAPPP